MISEKLQADIERHRQESRERYPKDTDGRPHCPEHGPLEEEGMACRPCYERDAARRRAEEAKRHRIGNAETWWSMSASPPNALDGFGKLPEWPWARFDNEEWIKRCDRRVIDAVRSWNPLSGSVSLFAGTGGGKTSGFVAALWRAREAVISEAADNPRWKAPSRFLYCTGYELAEATKRRRLGAEDHVLVRTACTQSVVILDELHPNHTPADLVFQIIDTRVNRGLPLVVSSGMRPVDFGAAFGAAALRRVVEAGTTVDTFSRT